MPDEVTTETLTPPRLLPPHYFVLALATMLALGYLDGSRVLPGHWHLVGIAPILAGLVLAARGSRLFARAGTNIVPFTPSSALVTEGVFGISRNPMYAGMVLALTGVALLLNGWLPWLTLPPFVAIIRFYFVANEAKLRAAGVDSDLTVLRHAIQRHHG